jgi:hypothetical protein
VTALTRATYTLSALLLTLCASFVAGCDAVQEKAGEVSGQALENGVREEIERRLAQAGVELQGDLDCTSDKDLDAGSLSGVVSVNCNGKVRAGGEAVAVFNGSISPDGCTGRLTVTAGGREIYNDQTGNLCGGG